MQVKDGCTVSKSKVQCPSCGRSLPSWVLRPIRCICGATIDDGLEPSAVPTHLAATRTYGLGDIIAFITRYTGIAWLMHLIFKKSCGCEERRKALNKINFFSR